MYKEEKTMLNKRKKASRGLALIYPCLALRPNAPGASEPKSKGYASRQTAQDANICM